MKKLKIKLSVVIPAYNEEKRILKTLSQVDKYLAANFLYSEIIVASDGSTDETEKIIDGYIRQKHSRNIRIYSLKKNQGKGAAVKLGVSKAKKAWVLIMDADSATPISDVGRLLKKVDEAEVIFGSRYLDRSLLAVRQPLPRRIIGRVGNLLARAVLHVKLVDTQCGFKLISSHAAKTIFPKTSVKRWGWDLEVLAIAQAHGIKITEVPVKWRHMDGSTFRASRGVYQTLKELFAIRRNLKEGLYE